MPAKHTKTLYIFRRDLRLDDNVGLMDSLESSNSVIPCFILDPRQAGKHVYYSKNAFQFMVESLIDLRDELRKKKSDLYVFTGKAEEVVKKLIYDEKITAVYLNSDYTPFSNARDKAIGKACNSRQISLVENRDSLINPPEFVTKQDGNPYTVFTPYYKNARKTFVDEPFKNRYVNYYRIPIASGRTEILEKLVADPNPEIFGHGGRKQAGKILRNMGRLANYERDRDFPSLEATTGLSAHLKFGTVSVREIYHVVASQCGEDHPFLRQLYWRDFFTYIGFNFPHVFGHAFHEEYDSIKWENDESKFWRWVDGLTGFPIVDAGMRQLRQTGFMHNRARMITASFLTKDLHIDWRWGERYFANELVDYDPSVNNGNWQWAASTGCDVQPYFRIFNPWLQQKKFDPDCEYIKEWIPELEKIPSNVIHSWYREAGKYKANYPVPIVDHKFESERAKDIYRGIIT